MKKIAIILVLILSYSSIYGNNQILEKTREKYNVANSIIYNSIATYPNPDTDEVTIMNFSNIFNFSKNQNFDFYSKLNDTEEYYLNGEYSYVKNDEKTIYKYEEEQNKIKAIASSRVVQYNPKFLLKNDWKFDDIITINGKKYYHYTFLQDSRKYNDKTIKTIYNIFISPSFIVSKFERKSYVDDKLGQTVTYEYKDYKFSKKRSQIYNSFEKKYALKYFERNIVIPLTKGEKAPSFEAKDLNNKIITSNDFKEKQTLLLFSSTSCGYSLVVSDYISNANFKLSKSFNLIDIFGTDKKEAIESFIKKKNINFPIICNRKDIETEYKVNGYPILYQIDENGIIKEVYQGDVQINQFLESLKEI